MWRRISIYIAIDIDVYVDIDTHVDKEHKTEMYNNAKKSMYKNNSNYKGLFICEGKKPVGYILYYICKESKEIIDLLYILIDKNKRNNGYGTILIKHLQQKYLQTVIAVRIDNDSLIGWYYNNGFNDLNDVLRKCEPEKKMLILTYSIINKSDEMKMYYV
jgi:ribosomal protein S18 acetylase RimI-like enzyme